WHRTDGYANNRIECDHGRLKARLRPMGGLRQARSAKAIIAGQAFVKNRRREHYELAVHEQATRRVTVASTSWSWRSDAARMVELQHDQAGPTQQRPSRNCQARLAGHWPSFSRRPPLGRVCEG